MSERDNGTYSTHPPPRIFSSSMTISPKKYYTFACIKHILTERHPFALVESYKGFYTRDEKFFSLSISIVEKLLNTLTLECIFARVGAFSRKQQKFQYSVNWIHSTHCE